MAGRGRGRGRGFGGEPMPAGLSINKADLAPVQKSENEPLPLFPPLVRKPAPLHDSASWIHLVRCKKQFQWSMDGTPFRITEAGERINKEEQLKPVWSYLPEELRIQNRTRKPAKKKRKIEKTKRVDSVDIKKRLQELESAEAAEDEEDDKDTLEKEQGAVADTGDSEEEQDDAAAEDKDADLGEPGEELDEEELLDLDEGADYVSSYFDGGEGYLDDEDDGTDEPTY